MPTSIFQMFKIGIGPSSSHTVGPMKAARVFLQNMLKKGFFANKEFFSVRADLYGSLALTGIGHGTDKAILLGFMGETPEEVEIRNVDKVLAQLRDTKKINLLGQHPVHFVEKEQLIMNKTKRLKFHSNGMKFTALNKDYEPIYSETYYSTGGGFIVSEEEISNKNSDVNNAITLSHPFASAAQMVEICKNKGMKISELMLENEKSWRTEAETKQGLLKVWSVMQQSVQEGCVATGVLPGPLKLPRRAHNLYQRLHTQAKTPLGESMAEMDWVNLFALAVSEQNAAGGRVVTAPTNGAAGIIPAVMSYYDKFLSHKSPGKTLDFLLTAGAVGLLFKYGATISGAEGGCQGEVGVAAAMAAAGLTAALGGTNEQCTIAAEIGIEHHLGLTCDPVAGLVQIPCIERNTMGAIKAINATKLALSNEEGQSMVSLDRAIAVMKQTGLDMKNKYKETAKGGLAAEFEKELGAKKKKERLLKQAAHTANQVVC
jgi:L-serine dehydratase